VPLSHSPIIELADDARYLMPVLEIDVYFHLLVAAPGAARALDHDSR
jgi:hypothetical protein